jgi:hypothetical protein
MKQLFIALIALSVAFSAHASRGTGGADLKPNPFATITVTADRIIGTFHAEASLRISTGPGTTRERFHNTTGTGALGGPTGTAPLARALYTAYYPDAIGRVVATADFGTNGGIEPERPEIEPVASDVCLVSRVIFNERGEVLESVDPKTTCYAITTATSGRSWRNGWARQRRRWSGSSCGGCATSTI